MKKLLIKTKKEKIGTEAVCDFNGLIDDVISHLKEKKVYYEKLGYTNITVEFEDVWGYYDDHYLEIVYYGRKIVKEKD